MNACTHLEGVAFFVISAVPTNGTILFYVWAGLAFIGWQVHMLVATGASVESKKTCTSLPLHFLVKLAKSLMEIPR